MVNRTKAGISFGVGMTVFLILRSFFLEDESNNEPIFKIILTAMVAGVVSGFVVGWLVGTSLLARKGKKEVEKK